MTDVDVLLGEATAPLRMAWNESALAPPRQVVAAVAEAAERSHLYPGDGEGELRSALGQAHGQSPESVLLGSGSSELFLRIALATVAPGRAIVFATPSYPVYELAARTCRASAVPVPLRDHTHDADLLAAAVDGRTAMVVVCNPHNPTGTVVARDDVARLAAVLPGDCLLVVDEAYAEFADGDISSIPIVARRERVLVLRTFSKAYGLAGLRVGYAVTTPRVAEEVERSSMPFLVNRLATAGALAALQCRGELLRRVEAVKAERARVWQALTAWGFRVPRSHGNFLYVPVETGLPALLDALAAAGIVVAPQPEGFRVTIGLPEMNDRFLDVVRQGAPGR